MPMNPEWKQKWVEALRSGVYPQTTGRLRRLEADSRTVGYCCLGVLCEIYPDVTHTGINHNYYKYKDSESGAELPSTLAQELGLTAHDTDQCIELNDRQRKTFAEIADYIEQNF